MGDDGAVYFSASSEMPLRHANENHCISRPRLSSFPTRYSSGETSFASQSIRLGRKHSRRNHRESIRKHRFRPASAVFYSRRQHPSPSPPRSSRSARAYVRTPHTAHKDMAGVRSNGGKRTKALARFSRSGNDHPQSSPDRSMGRRTSTLLAERLRAERKRNW